MLKPDMKFGTGHMGKSPDNFRTAWMLNSRHPDYPTLSMTSGVTGSYFMLPYGRSNAESHHVFHVLATPTQRRRITLNRSTALERRGMDPVGAPVVSRDLVRPDGTYEIEEIESPEERRSALTTHADISRRLLEFLEKPPKGAELDERDERLKRWLKDHVERSRHWFREEKELFD